MRPWPRSPLVSSAVSGSSRPADRPLSLAICAAGELWGGVEECIVTLTRGLIDRGVRPTLLLFFDGKLAEVMRRTGVPVVVLDSGSGWDPRLIGRLREAVRQHSVNVLHVHGYKATVIAALAARTCPELRIVKSEHGRLEPPSQWRGYPQYLRLVLNVVLDCVATRTAVDRRVYVSDEIRVRRERWCGPGSVIHNGIDSPSHPSRHSERPASGGFVVGIVGRLTAVKGHSTCFAP